MNQLPKQLTFEIENKDFTGRIVEENFDHSLTYEDLMFDREWLEEN